jgi:hypothetical protein
MAPHELLALIASGDPASLKKAGDYMDKLQYADKASLAQICWAVKKAAAFGHNQLYNGPLHAKYLEITERLQSLCAEAEATA